MENLLENLTLSGKHLRTLDKAFQKYSPYSEVSQNLSKVPLFDKLRKEIYAGGKKGKEYGRQMILGDILQYIFTGRGYYFAVRGPQEMESFIRILMHVSNLLILMEDISVDVDLRNHVLDALKREIGDALFESDEEKTAFQNLREYDGKIVDEEGEEYEDFYDSILPKRVGGIPELLVYANLIKKSYGYVVPLLQAQRLLGNRKYITPPDFLLLRSKGEIFGVEVGTGKERQITSFSTITSTPTFTVTLGSFDQPQPYRCGKCQRWITYCNEVIDKCAKNEENDLEELDCMECRLYKEGTCKFIVYHGNAKDHSGNVKNLRYHYACVRDDPVVHDILKRARSPKLIAPIPFISGLESIEEET